MRNGVSKCAWCPDPFMNSLRILGFIALILLIIYFLIWFNIRKTKESEASILGKIFTNYIHSITATSNFNFAYPQFIKDSMEPAKQVGASQDTMLSWDCFIDDFAMGIFADSNFIRKAVLSFLLPVAIIAFFVSIFLIYKFFRRSSQLKRNIVISLITIIYFMHPSITEKTLSMFRCTTVYEDSRLLYDLELKCWVGQHRVWALGLALPMLILCYSFPVVGIVGLTWKRAQLRRKHFRMYFLILYQGMRSNRYYWEFVNVIRKIMLLMISVFIPQEIIFYKLVAGFSFLVAFL